MTFSAISEFAFALGLLINAVLFIPQAYKLLQKKDAQEISLVTFVGFWLIQLITAIHGYQRQDYVLFAGYLLAMITCGWVIVLTFYYQQRARRS